MEKISISEPKYRFFGNLVRFRFQNFVGGSVRFGSRKFLDGSVRFRFQKLFWRFGSVRFQKIFGRFGSVPVPKFVLAVRFGSEKSRTVHTTAAHVTDRNLG